MSLVLFDLPLRQCFVCMCVLGFVCLFLPFSMPCKFLVKAEYYALSGITEVNKSLVPSLHFWGLGIRQYLLFAVAINVKS